MQAERLAQQLEREEHRLVDLLDARSRQPLVVAGPGRLARSAAPRADPSSRYERAASRMRAISAFEPCARARAGFARFRRARKTRLRTANVAMNAAWMKAARGRRSPSAA